MERCAPQHVLHVDVGGRELGKSLGVQEAVGEGSADELGAAVGIKCAGIDTSQERSEQGFLREASGVEVQEVEPVWYRSELNACDTQLVVETGVVDVTGELDLWLMRVSLRGRHAGLVWWHKEVIDELHLGSAACDVVHQILGFSDSRRRDIDRRTGGVRNCTLTARTVSIKRARLGLLDRVGN